MNESSKINKRQQMFRNNKTTSYKAFRVLSGFKKKQPPSRISYSIEGSSEVIGLSPYATQKINEKWSSRNGIEMANSTDKITSKKNMNRIRYSTNDLTSPIKNNKCKGKLIITEMHSTRNLTLQKSSNRIVFTPSCGVRLGLNTARPSKTQESRRSCYIQSRYNLF